LLLAWVLGNALQLQQAQLGTDLDYLWPVLGCCLFAGLVHMGWRFASWPQTLGPCLAYLGFASVLLSVAAFAYASVGWRALLFQQSQARTIPPLCCLAAAPMGPFAAKHG